LAPATTHDVGGSFAVVSQVTVGVVVDTLRDGLSLPLAISNVTTAYHFTGGMGIDAVRFAMRMNDLLGRGLSEGIGSSDSSHTSVEVTVGAIPSKNEAEAVKSSISPSEFPIGGTYLSL
jgi:hypothetical protein